MPTELRLIHNYWSIIVGLCPIAAMESWCSILCLVAKNGGAALISI